MASSEEDGTAAAAADQLGSLSLGQSVERKDDETESNEAPTKLCSACGEKSDALMKCRACKCVWYCDKDCQNKHWKEHKKECKPIKEVLDKRGGKLDLGEELDVGPLAKVPPREECPICMHVLPINKALQSYHGCCGKIICCGCEYQHKTKNKGRSRTCPFCRTAVPRSDEEILAQLHKRVELKDPNAMRNMAMGYGHGQLGLPVDQVKCIELLRESAANLGCPAAQYQLGNCYDDGEMGLERNEEEALKYWGKAADGGHVKARHNIGCAEGGMNGDHVIAMRHLLLAASGGYKKSMNALILLCFEDGLLRHGDLSESLQAFYRSRGEMKSGDRDQYIKHLKEIGKYKDDYEC